MYQSTVKIQGFTIIELMVTLAIAAILVSLAAPSFKDIIQNNRMTTQYNELLASLSVARSESIKRGEDVIALSSNGNNWEDGWTVFVDTDGDGAPSAAETIRVGATLSGNNTLRFDTDNVTYASNGLAIGIPIGTVQTFTLCDDRGNGNADAKGLIVSATGRVRHTLPAENAALACP